MGKRNFGDSHRYTFRCCNCKYDVWANPESKKFHESGYCVNILRKAWS